MEKVLVQQANSSPDATAVEEGGCIVSYRELIARADVLVDLLQQSSFQLETPVCIIANAGLPQIIGQIAVLRAGGICVPLNPPVPSARLKGTLQDLESSHVITSKSHAIQLPDLKVIPIEIAQDENIDVDMNVEICVRAGCPDTHRSHILFTSGSTGRPKPIQILSSSILHVLRQSTVGPFIPSDRMSCLTTPGFDLSLFEVWGSLLGGAAIIRVPDSVHTDPFALEKFVQKQQISIMIVPTALFNIIALSAPSTFCGLRHVIVGGEAVTSDAVRNVLANASPENLWNAYGPAEATIYVTVCRMDEAETQGSRIGIGRAFGDTRIYLLNESQKPIMEPGETGEICIAGPQLSPGYLNRPQENQQRFILMDSATFGITSDSPIRLYRTGDMGQWRDHTGNLDYLGRADEQVKISGYRIELGEVARTLERNEQVHSCVRDIFPTQSSSPSDSLFSLGSAFTANCSAHWENQLEEEKIIVLEGDMTDLTLGLSEKRFTWLTKWASVVFHVGARVNRCEPYEAHYEPNIVGTRNIIRATTLGLRKALRYVSRHIDRDRLHQRRQLRVPKRLLNLQPFAPRASSLRIIQHVPMCQAPRPAIQFTPDEHRSLEFFQRYTVPCFAADVGSYLLQAAYHNPIIRPVAIAAGSIHRSFTYPANGGRDDTHFALLYYNKAIRSLVENDLQHLTKANNTVLMACVLFFCCECLQGRYKTALQHASSGIRIIQQQSRLPNTSLDRAPAAFNSLFHTLESQILEIEGAPSASPEARPMMLSPPLYLTLLPLVAPPSIGEFQRTFEALYHRFMQLDAVVEMLQTPSDDLITQEQRLYMEWARIRVDLQAWTTQFKQRIATSTQSDQQETSQTETATIILKIWELLISIYLHMDWPPAELAWDQFTAEFETLVLLASSLVDPPNFSSNHSSSPLMPTVEEENSHEAAKLRPLLPRLSKSNIPIFSPCLGIVTPLYVTAVRCRDSTIRHRAIDILVRCRRREGLWDSDLAARIASQIAAIEEAAAGIEAGTKYQPMDIGLDARVRSLVPQFGEGREGMIQYVRDGNDEFGRLGQNIMW
ncbi:hypothetical protein BBP40_001985 [Aspergillus hancockii]|nr:hypothetical protein BBP40_001985 [Aspergillus hancockii]